MFTEQQKRKIEKDEGFLMARVKLPDDDRICDYCNQPLTGEVYAHVIYWPLHPRFKDRFFIPPKKRWYIMELYCLPCGKKLARKFNELLVDHIIHDLQKYLEHYLSGNLESYFSGKEE